MTLDAPVCTTMILARLAGSLVRAALADHPGEKIISLLAISVSHLEEHWDLALDLPLGLADEALRPGSPPGMARWAADCAIDRIRDRFGWARSDTVRRRWRLFVRSPMSFASLPRKTSRIRDSLSRQSINKRQFGIAPL
ncbi:MULTISPECIES: hypothetical protein [unclassified Bradyrhizobium]|uniref:hypothetical protein n=1 Tax=unclassified Bradyrhizobium TaxID=2631580 RepID=UPI0004902CB1|nr:MULTISPECIES: hypothetical protein [unclassified Bradyrhizobium]